LKYKGANLKKLALFFAQNLDIYIKKQYYIGVEK